MLSELNSMVEFSNMYEATPEISVVDVCTHRDMRQVLQQVHPYFGLNINCNQRQRTTLCYTVGGVGAMWADPTFVAHVPVKATVDLRENINEMLRQSKSKE